MPIRFYNDDTPYRLPQKRATAGWVESCVSHEGLRAGEITFVFCSRQKHLEMNRTCLGHDYPTDVITFDYSDLKAGMVAGEIYIDPQSVRENARRFGVASLDEMHRVVIHGVLHLCGYGDKTPAEQTTMRAKEDACLAQFGF